MRSLVAFVIAVAVLAGCGTNKDLLGPGGGERDPSNISMRKYQIIYPPCLGGEPVTLDYPAGFDGPIPRGHGRIGSTSSDFCARSVADDLNAGIVTWYRGDPTDTQDGPSASRGFVGDPDSPERGDGDGTDVKARYVGGLPGDPTSDD